MSIQNFLDLSTGCMQRSDSELLEYYIDENDNKWSSRDTNNCAIRVIGHEYGYWVHVPFELEEQPAIYERLLLQGFSEDFINVLKYAYQNTCWWINFDQDADTDNNLPVFDW